MGKKALQQFDLDMANRELVEAVLEEEEAMLEPLAKVLWHSDEDSQIDPAGLNEGKDCRNSQNFDLEGKQYDE